MIRGDPKRNYRIQTSHRWSRLLCSIPVSHGHLSSNSCYSPLFAHSTSARQPLGTGDTWLSWLLDGLVRHVTMNRKETLLHCSTTWARCWKSSEETLCLKARLSKAMRACLPCIMSAQETHFTVKEGTGPQGPFGLLLEFQKLSA